MTVCHKAAQQRQRFSRLSKLQDTAASLWQNAEGSVQNSRATMSGLPTLSTYLYTEVSVGESDGRQALHDLADSCMKEHHITLSRDLPHRCFVIRHDPEKGGNGCWYCSVRDLAGRNEDTVHFFSHYSPSPLVLSLSRSDIHILRRECCVHLV